MRSVFILLIFTVSLISRAQSISPIMSAGVKYSKNDVDNTFFLSPEKVSNGFYERIELLEIDDNLVLRCEEGKTNSHGFVEESSIRSIMFIITNLTYEWLDTVQKEGICFKGKCSNHQLGYDLPFVFIVNRIFGDTISIGHNTKKLDEIKNYDLNRLFTLGKMVESSTTSTQKPTLKNKINNKQKPKLTK